MDTPQPAYPTAETTASRRVSAYIKILFTGILIATTEAAAQTSAPAAPPKDDDRVELSPFTVNASTDRGYAATETLAGTRMRTSLKDVGASLTVLTPEFLQDLAVNSLDQALLYTPSVDSVDGDNSDGNRANGGTLRFGTGQAYSIRGFVSNSGEQSISHDFFAALEPTDNYNLERITLSLGPNALLIGVGNPQGVAVTTTKRAQMQLRKTQLSLQTDTNGSFRAAIDHNQPLIKDKLALRVNLLHDQARKFRTYEGSDQARMTLGLSAKPFPNTSITVNHESYTVNTNTASMLWGFDPAAIRWAAAGKPTIEFLPGNASWAAAGRQFVNAQGNRIPVAAGVVDADGFVDAESDFDPRDALVQNLGQAPTYVVGLNLARPLANFRFQGNLQSATFGAQGGTAYQSDEDPWDLLGLDKTANLNGGTWDDAGLQQHGRWSQILIEQKLAQDLYLEVAANLADFKQDLDPNTFTTVTIDPNRYLMDGSLNPGYLQPYAENAGMQWRAIHRKALEYRATLSYELDLTKRNRWLGSHNLSGLFQGTRREEEHDVQRVFNAATVGLAGWSPDALAGVHFVRGRAYFVDGNLPVMPDVNQVLNNLAALNASGTLFGATATESAPINLSLQSFIAAPKSKFNNDSISLGWQGRWLDGRLITVAGYRRDDVESFGASGARTVALSSIPNSSTDVVRRYFALSKDTPFNDTPSSAAVGISRTYGAVLHALPWLSLTYNESANFLPVSNATLKDALGRSLPNSIGTTQEYGLRFYLLEGKLSLSLTKFETTAGLQARNANATVTGTRNILTRLRTNYKATGDSHFTNLAESGFYPVDTGNVTDTWDFVSDGYEANLVYNPSRNWRMALSGSSNENVTGDHLLAVGEYLYTDTEYQGLGTWRRFATELNKVAGGQASAFFDLDPNNPAARSQAAADALFITEQANAQETVWLNEQAITGVVTNRNGKYGANGLITRIFHEGRLKGWSIGGNFRWRSASVVTYENFRNTAGNPNGLYDVSKPVKGKEFWDVGAMLSYQRRLSKKLNLRVQLNIQNLPNWQTPRLVKSDYDLVGYKGAVNEIVPVLWELRAPRNFILTTTLDF